MRLMLTLLAFCTLCLSNVLSPKEAFKLTQGAHSQGVFVQIHLAKDIFLYKQQLKVLLNGTDISEDLNLPQAVVRGKDEVFYNGLELNLPHFILQKADLTNATLEVFYQGCSESGFCYRPMSAKFEISYENGTYHIAPLRMKSSNSNEFVSHLQDSHLFVVLAVFFGYGLLLSLTPCTLPMIPILSSLILAKNAQNPSKKRALWLSFVYVLFMSLAYALAGVITAMLGASVQGLLQKPIVLIFFALILVILALACFGVFHLSLPAKLQKFNPAKNSKGVLGVALMGFLSAFIIGPCVVAPLAAALLYIASSGDIVLGALALFVLSFGMGVPLLFVGLGLSFIKAGAWTQRVNVFFGFVMLAMAVWVLARFVPGNYILMAYGVLGVFFVSFMGLWQSAHNAFDQFKKALLVLILAYSLSLFLGGLFGAKDFLNPFKLSTQNAQTEHSNFKYLTHLDAIKQTLKENDKVMLDFTASWCENCKLLDKHTFSDERVIERLKDYTLIKIDISDNDDKQMQIMKEFNVFAPPVLIFFEKGTETLRLVGFVNADEFLHHLP